MKDTFLVNKRIPLIFIVVLLISVVQTIGYAQGRPKIYWTESDKIRRANLDGTNVEDVITELGSPSDIALDTLNQNIYWVNFDPPRIYRANIDGSAIEVIINRGEPDAELEKDLPSPNTITLDTNASKIYWGNRRGLWGIARSDLDGSNIEDIFINIHMNGFWRRKIVDAEKIQLDVKNDKLYIGDSFNDNISRMNLDGSNYEELGISINAPYGLVLDLRNNRMYWTHSILGKLYSSTLDGNNVVPLLSDLNRPTDIVLHKRTNKMYWLERNKDTQESHIRQAKLDGTNAITLYTSANYLKGLAIDEIATYDVIPDEDKLTTTWAKIKTQ